MTRRWSLASCIESTGHLGLAANGERIAQPQSHRRLDRFNGWLLLPRGARASGASGYSPTCCWPATPPSAPLRVLRFPPLHPSPRLPPRDLPTSATTTKPPPAWPVGSESLPTHFGPPSAATRTLPPPSPSSSLPSQTRSAATQHPQTKPVETRATNTDDRNVAQPQHGYH